MCALEYAVNQTANVEDSQALAIFLVWDDLIPQASMSNFHMTTTNKGIIKRILLPRTLNILSS